MRRFVRSLRLLDLLFVLHSSPGFLLRRRFAEQGLSSQQARLFGGPGFDEAQGRRRSWQFDTDGNSSLAIALYRWASICACCGWLS